MPIKKKLLIAFLPLVLLSVSLVAIFGFTRAREVVLRMATSHLTSIADLKRDKIEVFFDRLKGNAHIIQDYYNVRLNLPILIKYSKNTTNPEYVKATKTLDDQLHTLVSEKKEIVDLMLLTPEGVIVYASNEKHKQLDLNQTLTGIDKNTFEEGKKGVYFSHIFRPPSEAFGYQFGVLAAAPLFDLKKRFIGEVILEITMDPIYKSIQDTTGLENTGETLVVEDEGDHVLFLNPLRHDPDAALQRKIYYGDKQGIPAQRAAKGDNGSGVTMDYRGKDVLTAWRYLPSLGWGLVAKIDMTEVLEPIAKTRNSMVVIVLLIIMLTGIASWRVAESIAKPIRALHKGTEIIAEGNLGFKVGTNTQDEVGQLSRAFDQMTENLKNSTTSITTLHEEISRREVAEEKLKKAMAIKDEFTAMVSHELRTPMAVIEEGVSIILDGLEGEISDRQKMLLTMVKENSDRLVRLVNDVLDLEKMESGGIRNNIQENNINEIIKGVCKSMVVLAEGNGLKLSSRLDEHLPVVLCDEDHITQVLVNLVGNAIKFTEKGGVSITTQQESDVVHVIVQDTGPGIKTEDLSKLFQPFGQINMGGNKKAGTGLGLAISKKIILSHRGKIWVESIVGQGTAIHFTLPITVRQG